MAKRTSVYLTTDLEAAVAESGLALAELIRRGIAGPGNQAGNHNSTPVDQVVVPGQSRDNGVPQLRLSVVPDVLADAAPVAPPDADAVAGVARSSASLGAPVADGTAHCWRCDFCGAGRQTTDRCESCGWPKVVPR